MAGSQLSKSVASTYLTKLSYGYRPITIDEYDTTAEPEIQPGFVEVNGDVYEFTAAESITGWAGISNSTQAYIYIVPSGSSATAQFSSTAPTFSTSKQGWYNGNNRALWAVYKGSAGTTYELKAAMPPEPNVRYFSTNNYLSGDVIVGGDLDVTDIDCSTVVCGNVNAANTLTAGGNVTFDGQANIKGNIINSTGSVTVNDSFVVTGAATMASIAASGALSVTNNITCSSGNFISGAGYTNHIHSTALASSSIYSTLSLGNLSSVGDKMRINGGADKSGGNTITSMSYAERTDASTITFYGYHSGAIVSETLTSSATTWDISISW